MPSIPLVRAPKPVTQNQVITLTGDRAIKASEHNSLFVFNSTTSLNATLPPPAKGLRFRFFVKAAAGSGTGHQIKVAGSVEKVYSKVSPTGAAIAEAAGKGITNTQATEVKGDHVDIESDGTDWFVVGIAGTWAREA